MFHVVPKSFSRIAICHWIAIRESEVLAQLGEITTAIGGGIGAKFMEPFGIPLVMPGFARQMCHTGSY